MRCEQKNAYPSRSRAMDYARKRMRDNRTLDLRAYRCPHCGLWYLTHVPDRRERGAA